MEFDMEEVRDDSRLFSLGEPDIASDKRLND